MDLLATFCARLACGLIASLLLLSPSQVPPRFFRVQYLTALGLLAVVGFWLETAELRAWLVWGSAMLLTFAGSVVWHLEGHPGHRIILLLSNVMLVTLLSLGLVNSNRDSGLAAADAITSAAVLGAATSAMLMGHSYLIAPTMSLSPLYRLLGALAGTVGVRLILACVGLYWWTASRATGNLETETLLWLGVRWLIGLAGPLALGWLAWETARIRSTQSATGILYVVVILTFLGELTSMLLLEKTGVVM